MYNKVFLSVLAFLVFSTSAMARDMFSISVSDATPASFFNSGIESFYISTNQILSIKYSKHEVELEIVNNKSRGVKSIGSDLEDIMFNINNAKFVFNDDGTVLIKRMDDDYSCYDSEKSNCIYSDILVKNVTVENLVGKASDYSFVSTSKNDKRKFNIGSKIYTFRLAVDAFNFNNFDGFDSTVCTKDDDNACKIVVTDYNTIDKVELLEMKSLNNITTPMLFLEGDEELLYSYSQEGNKLIPHSKSCLKTIETEADVVNCIDNSMNDGIITPHVHPNGINYWYVDFNNNDIPNLIYWANNEGVAFKAFTNNKDLYILKTLNKVAVDMFVLN